MTISSETRKAGPYVGNGVTTAFPFAFKVFTAADVLVVRTNLSSVDTTLTLGTDYTVTLNADQNANPGGTVTLPSALALNFKLTLTSQVGYLQSTDLQNQGGFYPQVITTALDKLTILAQQLREDVGRAVKVSISSTATPDNLLVQIDQAVSDAAYSASVASGYADDSLGYLNDFKSRYYGALASDPSTDPLGAPVSAGDQYFNTGTLRMRVYTGTSWADTGVATPVTITTQRFSGNGSTTAFTLDVAPAFQAACEAYISGVAQVPGIDYTVSGATLTFTSAPPAGTNNIFVRSVSTYAAGTVADGSITAAKLADGVATADPGSNGIVARTGNKTAAARTITAGAGISVTNGNGVSGNPTVANTGVTSINGQTGDVTMSTGSGAVAWARIDGAAGAWPGGVSTVSRTSGSTTATITTANNHGLTTGNIVYPASGISSIAYPVTVTGPKTFTVTTTATTALNSAAITFYVATVLAGSNVSLVTKGPGGTGIYYVNFKTPLSDVNYAVLAISNGGAVSPSTYAAAYCDVTVVNSDFSTMNFAAFR